MQKSILFSISLILFLFFFVPISNSQTLLNYAGVFNGTSSYMAVPNQAEIAPTTAITIEAWVYPATITNPAGIVDKNYTTSYNMGISTARNPFFYPKGGATVLQSTSAIPLNQWSHVAATYDGAKAKIYINGVCTDSLAVTGAIGVNTDSLEIGGVRGLAVNFFAGKLDNVRIWNVARSAADIANSRFLNLNVFNPTGKYAGLAAVYTFDSQDGRDYSGTVGNTGTLHNITFENDSYFAVPYQDCNSSLVLDGASYCSATNIADFNATTSITLEAWVKPDAVLPASSQNIVNKSGGATRIDWELLLTGTSHLIYFGVSNEVGVLSGPAVTLGMWSHVAATYNSATGRVILYINGDSVTTGIFTGNPAINNNPDSMYIGGIGSTSYVNNKFKGQIDEVRIWSNTVRTSDQIKGDMYSTYQYSAHTGSCSYNFDELSNYAYLSNNSVNGNLSFRNNAFLSSSNLQNPSYLTSPIIFDPTSALNTTGAFLSTKRLTIATVSSTTTDSVYIPTAGTISSLQPFVLFNVVKANRFTIILKSPNGTTCTLTPTLTANNINDIMTVFDNTTSNTMSYAAGGVTAPFSPIIKPANSLAVFNGTQAQGYWKLSVTGDGSTDVSSCLVSGWGIKPVIVTAINDNAQLPNRFELAQNYPNPFNPSTTIRYSVANTSLVTLKVYDALGREVATLVNENKNAGTYSVEFNKPLASGVYIYKLQAGSYIESKKMILLK